MPGVTGTMSPGETINSGALAIEPIHTPGHTAGMLSLLINGTDVFTGDTLFKGSVGGVRAPGSTSYADLQSSIMDTLLKLPPETRIHPGHTDPTTVADELEHNTFVRIWRGLDPEGTDACTALGEPATLILLGDDYDGGYKAWVRWPDGSDDIVPGSRIERSAFVESVVVAKDKIPTSRVGRTAKIGGLAAGQAIRQAGTRAANVTRSKDGRDAALERRHIEAAEQIVTALGTMKGAAMKIGQVMSFLDVGLVPPEYRDEFQRKLAALRDAAPTVTFKDMRKVIEHELDEPVSAVFSEFDEEPIAAASIGQVYRASLSDGREVAVKVQYPGVAAAVRADMQNLGLILRLAKRIAPGMDPKAIGDEIRERIHEELDYELEAQNQRAARPDLPRPPVHQDPGGRHLVVA